MKETKKELLAREWCLQKQNSVAEAKGGKYFKKEKVGK